MSTLRRVAFVLFLIGCGGNEPATTTPEPTDPEPTAPEPTAHDRAPTSVNAGHECTTDADCADLTPIAPATWRCAGQSTLLRSDAPEGTEPMLCLLHAPSGDLYCNAIGDCPPPRMLQAYSESVACTAHVCTYSGHVSEGDAP